MNPNDKRDKKRKLTEEESIILDVWIQYASRTIGEKGLWTGGRSTLEMVQSYLWKHKIINSWGNKRPEIIW